MFEILYRITDNTEDLKTFNENTFDMGGDILGFFSINVNGYHYGRYHNYPLQLGEHDWERITDWLLALMRVYQELNRSGYVLLDVVDSYNSWIEFRKTQDTVEINLLAAEKEDGTTALRLTPLEKFEYDKWYIQLVKSGEIHSELVDRRNETVKLSRIRSELLRKASQYLEELREVNHKLLGNKKITELYAFILEMSRDNSSDM